MPPWRNTNRTNFIGSASSTSRLDHIARLHFSDLTVLREPGLEVFARDTPLTDLQPEPDSAFYGESIDEFDSTVIQFEVENAQLEWDYPGVEKEARKLSSKQSQQLLAHPSCASAYASLLQRRVICFREVLTAASRHADDHFGKENVNGTLEVGVNASAGLQESDSRDAPSRPMLVQQMLCTFLELADSSEGEASKRSLIVVGDLLAAQKPLVLVTERPTWLSKLLEWLAKFLSVNQQASDSFVKGAAAAAMLNLGVCSGSLRCILATLASLLMNLNNGTMQDIGSFSAEYGKIDYSQLGSGVKRLEMSCAIPPSSTPTGGRTIFLPISQLGSPSLVPSSGGGTSRGARLQMSSSSTCHKFVSVASDGKYIYVHSTHGLVKYGTGYHGTIAGHVYLHKSRYRSSERPWIACAGGFLYLRSPNLSPKSILIIDSKTLEEVGTLPDKDTKKGAGVNLMPEKGWNQSSGHTDSSRSAERPGNSSGASSRVERLEGNMQMGLTELELESSEIDDHMFLDEFSPSQTLFRQYHDNRSRFRQRREFLSPLEHAGRAGRAAALQAAREGIEMERRSSETNLSSERSPLISDGRYLHIISKSPDKLQSVVQPQMQQSDVREEDDESSEGGGQIGSTWPNFSFSIDTFDPLENMKHVRSVVIRGPPCDYGIHEGEGTLCCDVCGLLLMSSSSPGHRCQVCHPEYDLCDQCWMRGAYTSGHKPDHLVRQMDTVPQNESGGEQIFLPAFPDKCMEYQSFYTDGTFLMVIIPPHHCQSKVPGYLCRVFDMKEGHYLYDISLGDAQEDPRRELGKGGATGGSCYDPFNDVVWNIDVDGLKVRRWRHPWTSSLLQQKSSEIFGNDVDMAVDDAQKVPCIRNVMESILKCLYEAAEKHARCVMEPCHDVLQSWVPFCIEAIPETFRLILEMMNFCMKGEGAWLNRFVDSVCEDRDMRQDLLTLRTCMRLLVVNIGQVDDKMREDDDFRNVLSALQKQILILAEIPAASFSEIDPILRSTCAEASNALVAGFDIFFPDAEQQASLLCQLLEQKKKGRVLRSAAAHLAKPGVLNHIFSIFDGRWLSDSDQRMQLAVKLLLLLLDNADQVSQNDQPSQNVEISSQLEDSDAIHEDSHMLNLLAAFQRHMLSVPYSSSRSTGESELLLMTYVKSLLQKAENKMKELVKNQDEKAVVPSYIRVLIPTLITALFDNAWNYSISTNLASALLPSLQMLLQVLDEFNRNIEAIKLQDRAFSVKCTESRYLGGRALSIPRGKSGAAKGATKCHIPGASYMVIRLNEDVILNKKEQLKISWEIKDGGGYSNTIKGSHKGKRLWRAFRVPGDTVCLQYSRNNGHIQEDHRSSKNIKCSIYGCAKSSSLLMALDWLFDLELTLASLTAKLMWCDLRSVPKPISGASDEWIKSCLFDGGIYLDWAMEVFPILFEHSDSDSVMSYSDILKNPKLSMGGNVVLELTMASNGSTLKSCIEQYLTTNLMPPEWLDRNMLVVLGTTICSALMHKFDVEEIFPDIREWNVQDFHQLPLEIQCICNSALRFLQNLILETRVNLQHVASNQAGVNLDESGASMDMEVEVSESEFSIDSNKAEISNKVKSKAFEIMLRCMLVISTKMHGDPSIWPVFQAEFQNLSVEDKEKHSGSLTKFSGEHANTFRYGVDLCTKFLISDVPARKVIEAAQENRNVIARRKMRLQTMSGLLKQISFTSVKQIMISTFTTGPFPPDLQRSVPRFHITNALYLYNQSSKIELRDESAKLFGYLAEFLLDREGPMDRTDTSLKHLVLSAFFSLQLEPEDVKFMIENSIVAKLSQLMLDPSLKHFPCFTSTEGDRVDLDTLTGLCDAAMSVLFHVSSSCAQLDPSDSELQADIHTFLSHAIAFGQNLFQSIDALKPNESKDLLQLKTLTWLHGLAHRKSYISLMIFQNTELFSVLCRWAITAESPQIQRVVLVLLSNVIRCSDVCDAMQSQNEASVRQLFDLQNHGNLLDTIFRDIGTILGATREESYSDKSASSPQAPIDFSTDSNELKNAQWVTLAFPYSHGVSMDSSSAQKFMCDCQKALKLTSKFKDMDEESLKKEASELSNQLQTNQKCVLYEGSYDDCQSLSLQWESSVAFTVVIRGRTTSKSENNKPWRWRSGHAKLSVAMELVNFMKRICANPSLRKLILGMAFEMMKLSREHLLSSRSLPSSSINQSILAKGMAAVELFCAETDVSIRVGSRIRLPMIGSAGRVPSRYGIVVRCDHLLGMMCVLPEDVIFSKSLQNWVPITLPIVSSTCSFNQKNDSLFQLLLGSDQNEAKLALQNIMDMFACLRLMREKEGNAERWCRSFQSRLLSSLSTILNQNDVDHTELLANGVLDDLIHFAVKNINHLDPITHEVKRAGILSLLCESKDKAPLTLLSNARASGPGGGGGMAGSADSSMPVGSTPSSNPPRSQRMIPAMESFMRNSRAPLRNDQRRTRELAAANLAEITGSPLRLCQHALDRENGNQDRAANWIFEHGESFLSDHPEYSEAADGGGEGGNLNSTTDDSEVPLCLLCDCYSFYEDTNQSVAIESELGISSSTSGFGSTFTEFPSSVLDELRAFGNNDDRIYDERAYLSTPTITLLGRPRGGGSVLIPSSSSSHRAREESLRPGMLVILSELDVSDVREAMYGVNRKLIGRCMFVDGIEKSSSDVNMAKLLCYDSTSSIVYSVVVPSSCLDRVNRSYSNFLDYEATPHEMMRSLADLDHKLCSMYARSCIRLLLANFPANFSFSEATFGGRSSLMNLINAAAVGSSFLTLDKFLIFPTSARREKDALTFADVLQRRIEMLLQGEMKDFESNESNDSTERHMGSERQKRDRADLGMDSEWKEMLDLPEESDVALKEKRRKLTSNPVGYGANLSLTYGGVGGAVFQKDGEDLQSNIIDFLVDECQSSLKNALATLSSVEESSEHPYIRSQATAGSAGARHFYIEGVSWLYVVFDARCSLLNHEAMKFYSDAACTDLIATATSDDRRKAFMPLILPSPVWMTLSSSTTSNSTSTAPTEDSEQSWGFRVQALAIGEKHLSSAILLCNLLLNCHTLLARQHFYTMLEGLLDLLEKSSAIAIPHCLQLHNITCRLMRQLGSTADCSLSLALHSAFSKLMHEANARFVWESKHYSGKRGSSEDLLCPRSTYMCSLAELLATRSLVFEPCMTAHPKEVNPSSNAPWLDSLDQTMRIAAKLYDGKESERNSLIDDGYMIFEEDRSIMMECDKYESMSSIFDESGNGELSARAEEALNELFQLEPDAVHQVCRCLNPAQPRATKPKDFLNQAKTLAMQDISKLWEIFFSFHFDRYLVRWDTDRDAELVSLVNMQSEDTGVAAMKIPAAQIVVTEYYRRKLLRLNSVPQQSLQRRFILLKLFNRHLHQAIVLVDFSHRNVQLSIAATICELQYLIFYQTKASFHNLVLDWTACQSRNSDRGLLEVLIHRPGRRARDSKEKAEEHERWRLQISSKTEPHSRLEEFLVAPSDFGSAREMAADQLVRAKLVFTDPPNGSMPLRNKDEIKGNIALIERGGGQFVNVVRRAQEAGAVAVIMADSKEGPLFLMSTELGNSGDDVAIPAVLLSLADSMLLMMRGGTLVATISADGVLMQTYRQLRYVPAARLRQRDEMAWRVKFQGEGHQGYQGPYREAMSALCTDLQSPQLPLFIKCANAVSGIGDNRDKFVPRPSASSPELLDMFFFIGQLMGVAMRTQNLLSLDFPSLVWKSLIGIELDEEDLKATDYSCWSSLQFRDEDGQAIGANKFEELFQYTFMTVLTDGKCVPLFEGGEETRVTFERRHEYAELVKQARLRESKEQLSKMRDGLCSIVPSSMLCLMTHEELERRVCGIPEIDIATLKRHTRYRGSFSADSPHIQMFWEVLEGFSQEDRRLFIRFAWGRERLPLESDYSEHSSMKLFPSDRGDGDSVLPEAETCFFIVKLPKYRTKELMKENLLAAITACREINY